MPAKREQILWKNVWPIAERLEKSFSLKAILSAAIVLFDQLSGDEQKDAIARVNKKSTSVNSVRQLLRTIGQMSKEESGEVIKFLSPQESKGLQILRDGFTSESEQKKKSRRG